MSVVADSGSAWRGSVASTNATPIPIATSWATRNIGTDYGAMPAKVSENIRAMVTAGLAKLVEDVK